MRTQRQDLRPLVVAIAMLASPAFADCPQGQTPASCALHEEAVALFTAGKHEEAATKFRAAIAAGPTARSYLGYSQAVEGQGKIALAYETMLVAQKYSNEEMAANGTDTTIMGRAERIKYKLAELGGKIGYVWLRLPDGVPQVRVVSVFREGEGDLASPIGRWIVVAPNRQVMFATLDDGARVQMVAAVGSRSQGTVVIPVPVKTATIQQNPTPPPFVPPSGEPTKPAEPEKKTPTPANMIFAVDAAFVFRDAETIGYGLGFAALFERKINARMALTGRGALVFHPSQEQSTSAVETVATSATEGLLLVGVRTRSKLPIYASFELGALALSARTTISLAGMADRQEDYRDSYAATLFGGGIRLGKVHLEVYALAVINTGEVEFPVRWFATFGVDLVRR